MFAVSAAVEVEQADSELCGYEQAFGKLAHRRRAQAALVEPVRIVYGFASDLGYCKEPGHVAVLLGSRSMRSLSHNEAQESLLRGYSLFCLAKKTRVWQGALRREAAVRSIITPACASSAVLPKAQPAFFQNSPCCVNPRNHGVSMHMPHFYQTCMAPSHV